MQRERSFLPSQESLRTTASPTQGYGHIESQNVPDETDGISIGCPHCAMFDDEAGYELRRRDIEESFY
ncbi:hypothetical protein VTJ04DRAFT_1872 [Mycothermus thermophilus]|uniref:uncharacterized protein n=1 Tax=Humicola insolens TaxID=85995 RepID=UPI003742E287